MSALWTVTGFGDELSISGNLGDLSASSGGLEYDA